MIFLVSIELIVSPLEVEGLLEEEEEIWEEEAETIFKEMSMSSPLNQCVEFVKEIVMLKRIVGSKGSHNVMIVKSLDMYKRIVDQRTSNKQILPRSKKLERTCYTCQSASEYKNDV